MQVGDIMHADVKTANPEDTFADVAKILHANGISSIVVLDGQKLAGILTERDVVNLVAAGGDPHTTTVKMGMTRRHLETVSPRTDIVEAAELMVSRNIRHLPVTDRGRVVGIVSIRDLTRWAAEELSGGHELPDIHRSHAALKAASELQRKRRTQSSSG
ncbi:MAG: cyclic nucleotide-binding/CBS domain-containing protein [Candidatus Velamenicoccus archaeovorus]